MRLYSWVIIMLMNGMVMRTEAVLMHRRSKSLPNNGNQTQNPKTQQPELISGHIRIVNTVPLHMTESAPFGAYFINNHAQNSENEDNNDNCCGLLGLTVACCGVEFLRYLTH